MSGAAARVVRAAAVADLPAVAAVAAASWHATYGGFLRPATVDAFLRGAYSEVALRRSLAGGGLWVLEPLAAAGGPVGFTRLAVVDGAGSLGALYLRPDRQRRGGGGLLLEHALAWFAGRGLARVELTVAERNAGARAFYRAHGFVEGAPRRALLFGEALVEVPCVRPLP